MKFVMAEKFHEKYLEDVVRKVSQDSMWRKKLLEGSYNEHFLMTYKELDELPICLWTTFSQYSLEFLISKVHSCPDKFDERLVILKVEAKEFPHVVKYFANDLLD